MSGVKSSIDLKDLAHVHWFLVRGVVSFSRGSRIACTVHSSLPSFHVRFGDLMCLAICAFLLHHAHLGYFVTLHQP